ncbi:hypothetical protein SDRG_15296 [Saprolegnia diclina VS20]|uniref:Uncharacterized protein n=1 Tax=Saprolegnia diclina (strain VS20) TaxID=1156394 RepID=T0R496_SAPDV|nr:hypothetical protein SDRG_15296 [Saprolegnia diclina VS20]EQC26873.1 hypothetical protein SDRG_15296 [Saprolegnia diclina VS20]|eukprot:XP_008619686.1 hypothetical protein SDRG_15296 [Saprolegnia diclina VS20]
MPSSKVGVERGPSPDAVPRFAVAYHQGAVALSVLVSCLIVAMPFEAYISETLPWATALPVPHDLSNLTLFNQTALATHQALYTRSTLPLGAPYYFDVSRNAHVCRHVISTANNRSTLVFELSTALALRGHRDDLALDHAWRYVVVIGDPTAPLVIDAYVVTAFFVDFSLSPHMVAVAVLRLLQVNDLWAALKAAIYLFRMVRYTRLSILCWTIL